MKSLIQPIQAIVESLGYEFYDLVFETREGDQVLSIRIDHENGIDIDDCVIVSEKLSDYLDETDPIETAYSLEVTSAGAERELRNHKDYHRALGKAVYVETFEQTLEGTLTHLTEATLIIKEKNNKTHEVLIADIKSIRRAIEF